MKIHDLYCRTLYDYSEFNNELNAFNVDTCAQVFFVQVAHVSYDLCVHIILKYVKYSASCYRSV